VVVARASTLSVATASQFTGVKTFTATLAAQRCGLGDVVTSWLRAHPEIDVVDIVVTQSSDHAYHCLTITVFFNDAPRR